MTAPWETITVVCQQCRKKFKTPAGRRRRSIRLNLPVADFCSQSCNKLYVAIQGKFEQEEKKK